ncbi:MAG: GIY-YIG nuclease family protein [Candidatus Oleimicrobiaceae bacterium]
MRGSGTDSADGPLRGTDVQARVVPAGLVWVPATRLRGAGQKRPQLPVQAGSYALLLKVSRPFCATVGGLGRCYLAPGAYLYVGSARRGLLKRLARHIRRDKVRRWHIDYLTTAKEVGVAGALVTADYEECALREVLETGQGWHAVLPGFGASDCSGACTSHLLRAGEGGAFGPEGMGSDKQNGAESFVHRAARAGGAGGAHLRPEDYTT